MPLCFYASMLLFSSLFPSLMVAFGSGRIITAIDDNSIRVWEPNPITDELVERISVSKLHSDVVQTFEPLPFGCIAT